MRPDVNLLISSSLRLKNDQTVDRLVDLLSFHGALGTRTGEDPRITDPELFSLIPLIFGLIPRSALRSPDVGDFRPIKPSIRAHILEIGFDPSNTLLAVLHSVATQFSRTFPNSITRTRKSSIADLRTMGVPYRRLREEQSNRCKVCGATLSELTEELDHIIPWRLIGDPSDGSNWQILCGPCNRGKSSFVSTLQSNASMNWIYNDSLESTFLDGKLSDQCRWTLLTQSQSCSVCTRGPLETELTVIPRFRDSLNIADHYFVVCSQHAQLEDN